MSHLQLQSPRDSLQLTQQKNNILPISYYPHEMLAMKVVKNNDKPQGCYEEVLLA